MASSVIKHLPELVENNVISASTAKDIEQYYASKPQAENTNLLTIFASLGGILIGLGLILIFAHNWDTFSRTYKTLLALLPLLLFQATTGHSIIKQKGIIWKNVSGTLLFFSVGASIALIGQIYNILGDVGSYLCSWIIVCLPLLYLLRSNTIAFLLLLFSTYYAVEVGYFSYPSHIPWFYLLFITAIIPYYLEMLKQKPNSHVTTAFNWLLPLSAIISFGTFIDNAHNFGFILYGLLLCAVYNVGTLSGFRKKWENGYKQLGSLGIIVILIIMSSKWTWMLIKSRDYIIETHLLITCLILFIPCVGISYNIYKRGVKLNGFHIAAAVFPIIYIASLSNINLALILSNITVLALSIDCIRRGINHLDFKILNFGLLTIAILIIWRFFDTQISFALRGILFLAMGAGFFTANYFLAKRKRSSLNNTRQHEN